MVVFIYNRRIILKVEDLKPGDTVYRVWFDKKPMGEAYKIIEKLGSLKFVLQNRFGDTSIMSYYVDELIIDKEEAIRRYQTMDNNYINHIQKKTPTNKVKSTKKFCMKFNVGQIYYTITDTKFGPQIKEHTIIETLPSIRAIRTKDQNNIGHKFYESQFPQLINKEEAIIKYREFKKNPTRFANPDFNDETRCYNCGNIIERHKLRRCVKCGGYKCPVCHHCFCYK